MGGAVMSGNTLIERARGFAHAVHSGERRKGKSQQPYTNHTDLVADLVEKAGGNSNEIAAAHAHDTVETGRVTLDEICIRFGEEVAHIVGGLTDPITFKDLPTLERKKAQAERVRLESNSIRLVKLADQIANLRSMAYDPPIDWTRQQCRDYIEGARIVAEACMGINAQLDWQFNETYKIALATHS